jgi:curved DNA-binding protein CbpA
MNPSKFNDFYGAIGLKVEGDPAEVTLDQINKAYKKTSKKYHPDKNPQGRPKFEAAATAVEQLRNETSRAKFDEVFRARQKEQKRLEREDVRTKRMREDLEIRERRHHTQQDEGPSLEALQRDTLYFTQATKTVLPSLVKTFTMEEHLARERVILKMAFQMSEKQDKSSV